MRSISIGGGLALACLWFGMAAGAADFLAEEGVAQETAAGDSSVAESPAASTGDGSLLCDSCGCADCCECDCYDCCDSFNDRERILGMLPSDHCFDDFISPLSNPFFFEDPRSLTEARGIFLDNSLPNIIDGGDAQVWAAQLRGRVSDRGSIIAPRLGYLQINQAGGGAPSGFMSAPLGFKYNFIRDVERQFLVSAGITYFVKGSGIVGSNFGGGDFHFFLTGGKQIFARGHWLSATGFRIPADSTFGTQLWYWSNQWDYEIVEGIYPLVGVNWFHYMQSSGAGFSSPVAGLDLIDLPVTGVAGNDIVSGVVGVKYKPGMHCEVGTGFEFPMTERTDILNNRFYADLIIRY
jgi:hypothetical protein